MKHSLSAEGLANKPDLGQMTAMDNRAQVVAVAEDFPRRAQTTGAELKRGAALNALAMLASNFRAVFTLLIARLLGPIALGIFSVAWATTDLVSKIGILGLDDAVITFVGRSEALGDRRRSRLRIRPSK